VFKRLFLLLSLALVCLAGCDKAALIAKFASESEQAAAKSTIDQLRARDFDAIEKSLDKSLIDQNTRKNLEKMSAMIPVGEPRSVKVVGVLNSHNQQTGTTSLDLTFEYEFPEKWMLMYVGTKEQNGTKVITGITVNTLIQSLEERNRFSLIGKQPVHYVVLACTISALLLTLYALIVCIRTKNLRRKWLWILFILIGVGHFAVNWTSGESGVNLLFVQLLSAGMASSYFGPWILSFSIPLGAIIFLFKHYNRNPMQAASSLPDPAPQHEQEPTT